MLHCRTERGNSGLDGLSDSNAQYKIAVFLWRRTQTLTPSPAHRHFAPGNKSLSNILYRSPERYISQPGTIFLLNILSTAYQRPQLYCSLVNVIVNNNSLTDQGNSPYRRTICSPCIICQYLNTEQCQHY